MPVSSAAFLISSATCGSVTVCASIASMVTTLGEAASSSSVPETRRRFFRV